MMDALWARILDFAEAMLWGSLIFGALGIAVRRQSYVRRLRRQWPEFRLNLLYGLIDAAAVLPLAVLLVDTVSRIVNTLPVPMLDASQYQAWPTIAVLVVAVAASDFIGYWRHRLMHSAALWPVHAIHHSDRAMTWTTLMRFHPINRAITVALDAAFLTMLGLPVYAVALSAFVRYAYGFFIHADLPWDFGPLRRVLVSPVLHKWHHCRDEEQAGTNFATVFALYDTVFGTWSMPDRRGVALGVHDPELGRGWWAQTTYPFRRWIWARAPEGATFGRSAPVRATPVRATPARDPESAALP